MKKKDPTSHRIIEKRRRDRMNRCLADLSKLIPAHYMKKGRGRVEKTEIIEMAIRRIEDLIEILNALQHQQSASPSDQPSTQSSSSNSQSSTHSQQEPAKQDARGTTTTTTSSGSQPAALGSPIGAHNQSARQNHQNAQNHQDSQNNSPIQRSAHHPSHHLPPPPTSSLANGHHQPPGNQSASCKMSNGHLSNSQNLQCGVSAAKLTNGHLHHHLHHHHNHHHLSLQNHHPGGQGGQKLQNGPAGLYQNHQILQQHQQIQQTQAYASPMTNGAGYRDSGASSSAARAAWYKKAWLVRSYGKLSHQG